VLRNRLLSGVRNRCQSLRILLFSPNCCLINVGQSYALSVSVCSGVVFQAAYCIVLLKNLTVASLSSLVLRETSKVNILLMSCLKSSQFVCLLLMLGCSFCVSECDVSMKTGE
jgi:hypothetical protein